MLRLTTFGGVGLRRVEGDPAIPSGAPVLSRRGLALLVLLAAGSRVGTSRDSLVAFLWPESDEERARNALRQTLFTIRRDLGLGDLILGGAELTLNPEAVTSDVRELELAGHAGELERIVELYTGPFLEGFHLSGAPDFDRWVDGRRAEYAAQAAAALEALARGAAARGDHAAAAESWRRLIALDPLNTRFVLESLTAQAASGNVAGALRQAQAHEELLRQELGAAPDRALTDLVARLRNGGGTMPLPSPPARTSDATAAGAPEAPPVVQASERFRDRLARELAGRFILEEAPAGREGSVRLYQARDRRHDRRITLKVVHPALASQIDIERFVREIRLTAQLLHPHILPLIDSGEVGGRPWFATPSPDGETLRARLAREACVPLEEAVRLTLELADALAHAHAHGIVHRDVSPENVLLAGPPPGTQRAEPGGQVHALLTNLGVARALNSAADTTLTDTGTLIGAAAYMSPEQADGVRAVDARSDVYSLAAVLFEMLAGEPLFSGPTPQAIIAKRVAEPTPGASRLHGMPAGIRAVIRRALAKEPGSRYASMPRFASALREAVSAEPRRWSWRGVLSALTGRQR